MRPQRDRISHNIKMSKISDKLKLCTCKVNTNKKIHNLTMLFAQVTTAAEECDATEAQ